MMRCLRISFLAALLKPCALAYRVSVSRVKVTSPLRTSMSMKDATPSISVTVLGGTGFVGSRVCASLVGAGASVRSVSKSGRVPDWCSGESWVSEVEWIDNELTRGSREGLMEAVGSPDSVVSCVGAIGADVQSLLVGNGVANAEAAAACKRAGVKKFVFVSVASEVSDCASWTPYYMKDGYFKGKADAEAAIVGAVGAENAHFVRPSFIYGGDSFGLFPPRVNVGYGSAVEEILSKGFFGTLADVLPGLIGVAFRPPVSVDAVAAACSGCAMGTIADNVLDGTAAINAATGQPAATGLTDFLNFAKEKAGDLQAKAKELQEG